MKILPEFEKKLKKNDIDPAAKTAESLARAGDIEGANSFVKTNPQHQRLLINAFAKYNPGLLSILRDDLPTIFESESASAHLPSATPSVIQGPGGPGGGGGTTDLPPVIVSAPAPPYPDPSYPVGSNPPPSGGGGGGGGGSSSSFGNINLEGDTPAHRMAILNLAENALDKLGYSFPAHYTISYVDKFAYIDKDTGEYRYSDIQESSGTNEIEALGRTDQSGDGDGGSIYIFRGAAQPKTSDGAYFWRAIRVDGDHQPSMSGVSVEDILDGGITGVQLATSVMAHELYHAYGHVAENTEDINDPTEIDARTYGLLARRALSKAILDERN